MNILKEIEKSAKIVNRDSKYVKINYSKIDEMISQMNLSKESFWLNSNPFHILDFSSREIINFLLIYHTIGDYCFWGDPKWTIKTENGYLDGSYAMMYLVLKRLKKCQSFEMTFKEFSIFLKGNGEIPLLEDRFNNLLEMNRFLKSQGTDFYTLVKDYNLDCCLFDYIIKSLSYFKDESIYNDKTIYFYKRAQLLTSDILHVKKIIEGMDVEYGDLVGCADYKIPQVMRNFGVLEYSEGLSKIVDGKIELAENSLMEIEIRANDLVVIDYIAQKLNGETTRMDINDCIWLLGQDKSKMSKTYHRTLTKHY